MQIKQEAQYKEADFLLPDGHIDACLTACSSPSNPASSDEEQANGEDEIGAFPFLDDEQDSGLLTMSMNFSFGLSKALKYVGNERRLAKALADQHSVQPVATVKEDLPHPQTVQALMYELDADVAVVSDGTFINNVANGTGASGRFLAGEL